MREAVLHLSGYRYRNLAECYKTAGFNGINRLSA